MKFYLAPLEGITGYVYRNAYHTYFAGMDKYFVPFISPNQFGRLSAREKNDILPEHNKGMYTVPQILTNSAQDFLSTAKTLKDYGYGEVNLNLGCPSKTVVTKGRGSGFLSFPDKLEFFLDEIFAHANLKISVKTRIGREHPEEFVRLLEIYNHYPMEELIIHPRLQSDVYKNTPNWHVFGDAVSASQNKLCYNGDICTKENYVRMEEAFPQVQAVMIGRGILADPGLIGQIRTGKGMEKEVLLSFHNQIYQTYQQVLFGEKTILFKMKEFWFYLAAIFTNHEKYLKKIKKSEKLAVYEDIISALFTEQQLQKGRE